MAFVLFLVIFTVVLIIFIYLNSYFIFPRKNGEVKWNNLPIHSIPSVLYFFMQTLFFRKQELDLHVKMFRWNGAINRIFDKERIVGLPTIGSTIVHIYKPEYLEALLNSNTLLSKSWFYDAVTPWLGDGLILSSGKKWRARRKLLTPAFHFKILEGFLPVFNTQSNILINKLKMRQNEPFVDIQSLISLCTLDIIGETSMGIQLNSQQNNESEYVTAIHVMEAAIVKRASLPWLRLDFIFYLTPTGRAFNKALAVVHNFTRQVIAERKNEIEQKMMQCKDDSEDNENVYLQTKKRMPLLDLLLHRYLKEGDITEKDIREEVDTFMFGGHDTTAMAISWAIYNIGVYPTIQTKVHEELDTIFGGDRERSVTSEDIREMKYLECVIKESLRLYPPVPFISRSSQKEGKLNDILLPQNAVFTVNTFGIHRDPELFKDPEKFDPERFFPQNSVDRHPLAYIPFSAGPRNCIGQKFAMMEEKTILANILRNFKVESLDAPDKIVECGEIILRPLHNLRIRLIKR